MVRCKITYFFIISNNFIGYKNMRSFSSIIKSRNTIGTLVRSTFSTTVNCPTPDSAELKWNVIENAKSYRIEYISNITQAYNLIVSSEPNIILHNLLPNASYNYTISAILQTQMDSIPICQGSFESVCYIFVIYNISFYLYIL
jgi:hypothetical protein